jgi:trimeric autotransporter adhesin
MGKRILILAVFSVLMSVLLFGIWSNIHVYAQQQSSPQPRKATANSLNTTTTKISPEIKAKMCNPSSPSLKVVNATESRICGIPRTVKPHTSSAQSPTSSASSLSTPPYQQALTTKPTSVASIPPPSAPTKHQQISNNNTNSISRTVPTRGATMAPVSNPTNRSLGSSLSSSPSSIAPQVKAVNHLQQQQQRQQQTQIKPINSTTASDATTSRQNYTLSTSTTPPSVTSDKTMYLGYHDGKSNPFNHDTSSTDKTDDNANPKSPSHSTIAADSGSTIRKTSSISTDSTNSDSSSTDISTSTTKPSNHHHAKLSTAADNGSTGKKNKNTDTIKIDNTPTTNRESESELASSIKNKVDSMIRNSISGIIHKTPFLLPFH